MIIHTADQPTAPRGRATEQAVSQDTRRTVKIKRPALSSPSRLLQNYKDTKYSITKQGPNTELPQTMVAVRAILPDYGRYANYNTNSKNEYKRSLLLRSILKMASLNLLATNVTYVIITDVITQVTS